VIAWREVRSAQWSGPVLSLQSLNKSSPLRLNTGGGHHNQWFAPNGPIDYASQPVQFSKFSSRTVLGLMERG